MDLSNKHRDKLSDVFEEDMDCHLVTEGPPRTGYIYNIKPHKTLDENKKDISALLIYLIEESGKTFKTTVQYFPYFYIHVKEQNRPEVISLISRQFTGLLVSIELIEKIDLDQPNYLAGLTNCYIKLICKNVSDLVFIRNKILQKLRTSKGDRSEYQDYLEAVQDIREYDIIYYTRVAIDLDIRCGKWYSLSFRNNSAVLTALPSKLDSPGLRVLAFDIETTKPPLKFPDSSKDKVMMISYMIDGEGFLIINREIVSEDIEDFEYTPKPEYEGNFTVFNETNEAAVLLRFFEHIRETKPQVFVTYNGDYFDWPFIEHRATRNGISMEKEIGIYKDNEEYKGRMAVHMDCLYWVRRDAYLPQGSHGLKKVTTAKLGYNPLELDPEDMMPFAVSRPHTLAAYSVSDAVATYYLYKKMIHDFIFALCTIIPLCPDDVLRKGSGTLCEQLLMAQAYSRNIIFPNKAVDSPEKFYNGYLIESETYIGGHVECLQVGVYRSDFPVKFHLEPAMYEKLIQEIPIAIRFCAEIENNMKYAEITNCDEVIGMVSQQLSELMNNPICEKLPLIYHLDVAAMYPNIILSNRLQPTSIVTDKTCASCKFNKSDNHCKRPLQ